MQSDQKSPIHRQRFLHQMKKNWGQLNSQKIASETLTYIRGIVSSGKYSTAQELVEILQEERRHLVAAFPNHYVMSNIVLSVIKVVCEEYGKLTSGQNEFSTYNSLNKLWNVPTCSENSFGERSLRKLSLAAISELASEIEMCLENMCSQVTHHFCPTDVVITNPLWSRTLCSLMETMCKSKRSFRVLLATNTESGDNNDMVSIVDVLTVMQRATRVLIAATAVFQDGSCLAPAGSLMICLAAKRHGVPVSVCAAFYKFTPSFVSDMDQILVFDSPSKIVSFSEARPLQNVQIVNLEYELIPAKLISLYISTSAFSPSHVYRFISDYYCSNVVSRLSS